MSAMSAGMVTPTDKGEFMIKEKKSSSARNVWGEEGVGWVGWVGGPREGVPYRSSLSTWLRGAPHKMEGKQTKWKWKKCKSSVISQQTVEIICRDPGLNADDKWASSGSIPCNVKQGPYA